MMKHVEQDHVVVFKRFGKEQQPRFQGFLFFNHELATKWDNVIASFLFGFFLNLTHSLKTMKLNNGF
jgi:hypothetical protein